MTNGKVSAFEVFLHMQNTDDKALKLAPLSNIIEARKVKQGTKVTMGVGEDICGKIMADELVGGLILVDRKRFDEVKAQLEAGAAK